MENNANSFVTMDKESILDSVKKNSGVGQAKLPEHIGLEIKEGILEVHIEEPCINMQEDRAAFDAWIVITKYWLGDKIKQVVLNWNSIDQSIDSTSVPRLHYNRFLYRVYMFLKIYPVWFTISKEKVDEIIEFVSFLNKTNCVLNKPLGDQSPGNSHEKSEHYIETLFLNNFAHLLEDKLGLTYLNNQLPVGVFRETIEAGTAVFPGGKGAVDLWGIDENNNTLSVFELKHNNKKAGIISELLFYVMLLYDACCLKKGLFCFDEKANDSMFRGIHKLTGQKYEALNGYFLVDDLHPLISNGVIELLNEGLSNLGNVKIGTLLYEYDDQLLKLKND